MAVVCVYVYVRARARVCVRLSVEAKKSRWLLYSPVKGGLTDRGSGHNAQLGRHKAP